MQWLAATLTGFDLHRDHNNLIFLFDPLSVVPDLSQTSLCKLRRWIVRLSTCKYTCFQIKGTDNVLADLLVGWSTPRTARRLVHIPKLPSSSDLEFEWPSHTVLVATQTQHANDRPPQPTERDHLWRNLNSAIWISDADSEMQLRLCIIPYAGWSGHRGHKSTEIILRKSFFRTNISSDVLSFVRACLHCLSTI